MTDTKTPSDKTLSVAPKATLSLKRPDGGGAGTVRQNFSHGRTKTVAVEVVKRRARLSAIAGRCLHPTPRLRRPPR
jgi:translation initiation factor IF-2